MTDERFNCAAFMFLAVECVAVYAWVQHPVFIWLAYGFLVAAAFNLTLALWGEA